MGLMRVTADMLNTNYEFFNTPMIGLHTSSTAQNNVDAGIIIDRANGLVPNVAVYWNESTQSFVHAFTYSNANVGGTLSNISVSAYANITVGNILTTGGLFWAGNGAVISTGGSGTGITYTANTAPPISGNTVGSQWYNTATDTLYSYEFDGTSYYWVDITSPVTVSSAPATLGNTVVTGNLYITSNSVSGSVTRVESNVPHPFMLMGAS